MINHIMACFVQKYAILMQLLFVIMKNGNEVGLLPFFQDFLRNHVLQYKNSYKVLSVHSFQEAMW